MTTAESSPKKQPLLSKLLWMFLITMIMANVAAQMYSSFMPLYLKSLGASVAIGSTIGIISYLGLFRAPSWQWVFLGQSLNAITTHWSAPVLAHLLPRNPPPKNKREHAVNLFALCRPQKQIKLHLIY